MRKIYLAGPMSNLPGLNFPAFTAAAAKLRAAGFEVVNPAEINGGADELVACSNMSPAELRAHWRNCMRRDIPALMECEGVAVLPDWQRSKGAMLEVHVAGEFAMPVMTVEEFLARGCAA